jgi:hypothetical protein
MEKENKVEEKVESFKQEIKNEVSNKSVNCYVVKTDSKPKKKSEEYDAFGSFVNMLVIIFVLFIVIFVIGSLFSGGFRIGFYKPNIYLYSDIPLSNVNVNLDINGELTATYPKISSNNTWVVDVNTDGTITSNKRQYNYLYWEGSGNRNYQIKSGWCVSKEDTIPFLEDKLTQLGLNEREQDDFISYWLPHLYENKYNVISFDTTQYLKDAKLTVSPEPDTMIRVFMTWYGTNNYKEIPEQELPALPERNGFTVVEWGGGESN